MAHGYCFAAIMYNSILFRYHDNRTLGSLCVSQNLERKNLSLPGLVYPMSSYVGPICFILVFLAKFVSQVL